MFDQWPAYPLLNIYILVLVYFYLNTVSPSGMNTVYIMIASFTY